MTGNLQSLIFTDQSDGESARKTEEMYENFSQLYLPLYVKRNQDKKMLEISRIVLKIFSHQMFGYPNLDAGLNTSQFGGDIEFSDRQHRPRLVKPCLRHFKSGDKTS